MGLLVIAIVSRNRERAVSKRLIEEKIVFTRIGSSGGFLKKRSATLLIGLEDESTLAALKKIFSTVGRERSALVSGGEQAAFGQEAGSVNVPMGAARLLMGGTALFVIRLEELHRY